MEDRSIFVPSYCQGLSILLVDNDKTSLMYLSSMLQQYAYNVTSTELATIALSMVEGQKDKFKLVMANDNMPDMDTLEFLHLLLEKDIPVILVSKKRSLSDARKAIAEGASVYLNEPISAVDLKYIWQHAYTKKRSQLNQIGKSDYQQNIVMNDENKSQGVSNKKFELEGNYRGDFRLIKMDNIEIINKNVFTKMSENTYIGQSMTITPTTRQNEDKQGQTGMEKRVKITHEQVNNSCREEEYKGNKNDKKSSSSQKKSRIVWTPELHLKFTAAISELGDQKARPKPILEIMNVPNLTARQVASHLQKYRSQVQRIYETGISNLPAVSRSSNFYGRTRMFEKIRDDSSSHHYQGTPSSNFGIAGNLIDIIKACSNNCKPVASYPCETSKTKKQVSEISSGKMQELDCIALIKSIGGNQKDATCSQDMQQNVMENSNKASENVEDADWFDEWMNEILNPDIAEMPNLDKIMKSSETSDAYDIHIVEKDRTTGEPNPGDVDRYCDWLTHALLGDN